jgi:hypothetical protein
MQECRRLINLHRPTGGEKLGGGGRKKFTRLFPMVPDLPKKMFRVNFPKLLSTGGGRFSASVRISHNFYIFLAFSTIILHISSF